MRKENVLREFFSKIVSAKHCHDFTESVAGEKNF